MTSILDKVMPAIRNGYHLLMKNDPLILSASTAFFTTFSLSPILIILTDLLTPILGKETVHRELFSKIGDALSTATAKDFHTIVDGFEAQETSVLLKIISTVFFYFIATTLLGVIKQAIHQLWRIKKKPSAETIYIIKERLTGVALMFLVAVLSVISYSMDVTEAKIEEQKLLSTLVGTIFSLVIIISFFTLLLKYLPEARIQWGIALAGGAFTGIFFNGGIYILRKVLVHKQVSLIFGVSSSIAIILLSIFYCSFILYLGVSFTYEFAKALRKPIRPGKYALEFTEEVARQGR